MCVRIIIIIIIMRESKAVYKVHGRNRIKRHGLATTTAAVKAPHAVFERPTLRRRRTCAGGVKRHEVCDDKSGDKRRFAKSSSSEFQTISRVHLTRCNTRPQTSNLTCIIVFVLPPGRGNGAYRVYIGT